MIDFPIVKINLGLNVIRRRPDGFHDLESVFYPVNWCDALEVIIAGDEPFRFETSGRTVPGDPKKNLCYRAWEMIAADFKLPNLQSHLLKVLPMGAGLGGGSSDGASMLKLINEVAGLGLNEDQLEVYASRIGSDCPFFIRRKPAFVCGRGEILDPFKLSLKGLHIAIIMPDITVGTAEAYSWIRPAEPAMGIASVLSAPIHEWKDNLVNDFESPVAERFPVIIDIKTGLYRLGALYASMSGSGSAVYGIFGSEPDLSSFSPMTCWKGMLE